MCSQTAALSCAQRHNRVDYIVGIVLQCLDRLLPRDTGLCHDELNVFLLKTRVVYLLVVVFFLFSLLLLVLLLALVVRVVVAGVIASGIGRFLSGELLSGSGLLWGVEVFDLGFTEDAAAD